MKKELHFSKAKSKNHPDAIKPSGFCFDEIAHFNSGGIAYLDLWNSAIEQTPLKKNEFWNVIPVPEDLSKEITKDTCKKLGI